MLRFAASMLFFRTMKGAFRSIHAALPGYESRFRSAFPVDWHLSRTTRAPSMG